MDVVDRGARSRPGPRFRRRLTAHLAALAVLIVTLGAGTVVPAMADSTCDPAGDVCVVTTTPVATPVGLVTVTVSAGNVVTVQLTPVAPNTLVLGVPFALPAWLLPSCPGGCSRTTIDTAGGQVVIDSVIPPGPPARGPGNRRSLPSLAVISIHPPGPCRVSVVGSTVVFTPLAR